MVEGKDIGAINYQFLSEVVVNEKDLDIRAFTNKISEQLS